MVLEVKTVTRMEKIISWHCCWYLFSCSELYRQDATEPDLTVQIYREDQIIGTFQTEAYKCDVDGLLHCDVSDKNKNIEMDQAAAL